jgi:hypothetical protein
MKTCIKIALRNRGRFFKENFVPELAKLDLNLVVKIYNTTSIIHPPLHTLTLTSPP